MDEANNTDYLFIVAPVWLGYIWEQVNSLSDLLKSLHLAIFPAFYFQDKEPNCDD